MSLMIQMLRKIKNKKGAKPVPPGLEVKKSVNKRVLILSVITLILIGSGMGIYYYLTAIPQQNILVSTEKIVREKPVNKNQTERVRNQITSPQKIEKEIKKESSGYGPLPPLDLVLNEIEQKVKKTDLQDININKSEKEPVDITIIEKEPDPAEISAYISLAEKNMKEGNLTEAYRYYKKVYSLKKTEDILNNLLVLAVETGNLEDMKKYLSDLKNEETVSSIAIKLIDNEDFYRAKEILDRYSEKEKKGYISYAYGYLYEANGDISRALFYYERAFTKNPSDPYIAYAFARMLEIKGSTDKAYKIYKKILNLSCDDEFLINIVNERLKLIEALGDR